MRAWIHCDVPTPGLQSGDSIFSGALVDWELLLRGWTNPSRTKWPVG